MSRRTAATIGASQAQSLSPLHGEKALVYRLLLLVNLLARPFQEHFSTRYDISLTEWRVMVALAARPGATVTEISEWSGLHVMNVSRSVARLVRQGRALRAIDPADRRRSLLRLSRRGKALFDTIAPSALAREKLVRAVLSEAEATTLRAMLDRLIEHLHQEVSGLGIHGRRRTGPIRGSDSVARSG